MSDPVKYFVVEGKMHSANVMMTLDISLEYNKESTPQRVRESLLHLLGISQYNEDSKMRQFGRMTYDNHLTKIVERQGKWHLMGGIKVIHDDDVFDTREEAAQAEYDKLMAS